MGADSPTMRRESLKLFFALAANEDFNLRSIDIRTAFLQAKDLERDIFLLPPTDVRKEGVIWKLKKPLYGLNDASRKFWLKIKEVFKEFGLKKLDGDEAMYYKHDKNGELMGLLSTHVDDFSLAGTDEFLETVTEEVKRTLDVSKIEDGRFRFTGIDIEQIDGRIELSMEEYADSLEDILIREDKASEPLDREEMRTLRKYVGKLSWLATNARPDLSIYALNLAKKQKQATLKDLRDINRILMKVREKKSKVVFRKLGKKENLCLLSVTDASYHVTENAVAREIIMIGNKKTKNVSPIYWKSGIVRKVCLSPKAAETRAMIRIVDDSLCLARQISILLNTGLKVKVFTNSRPLLESLGSSGQVEEILIENKFKDSLSSDDVVVYEDEEIKIKNLITKTKADERMRKKNAMEPEA